MSSKIEANQRRSANYHPSIWETERIESLSTPYSYDELKAVRVLEELKQTIRCSLTTTKDTSILLNLIDSIQRLGVSYHLENDIKHALSRAFYNPPDLHHQITSAATANSNLYMTALRFRVLRQHGFSASSDVFEKFRGQDGKFMENFSRDVKGLLSLYEASYFAKHGEEILDEAKSFTIKSLQYSLLRVKMDSDLAKQVQQSLEIPLRWRLPRAEARNFIDIYQMDDTKNMSLLEFAKLDYNLVQSLYQQELKGLARWWKDLGFKDKLSFARDRLMENYLCVMGSIYEPQFSKCRIYLTKFVCILTAIDDMYDVYGSLDELQSFTTAVYRWDMEAMMDLPLYMKVCYLAMFNLANELVYDVLKDQGLEILPYIKEEWLSLCRSYLIEAQWFNSGYTPTVDEYLENARTSVGGQAGLVHAYMLMSSSITKSSILDCFNHGSNLIYHSSLIARLSDDLGTSKDESERGDVAKSIECYMVEKGLSEEEAKSEIKELISKSWKSLNQEDYLNNSIPKFFVNMALNMARTAQFIFQHGDGIGTSNGVTRSRLASLIVTPIPIKSTH